MPCCGCSPCGGSNRNPGLFTEVLGTDTQNDIADCFKMLMEKLSCANNREMKKASTIIQKQLQDNLLEVLPLNFPEANNDCLAEVVPELVRVGVECIQECDPQNPGRFILCIAQRGSDHIVNLVRCLIGGDKAQAVQEQIWNMTLKDTVVVAQSVQAGLLECVIQILLPLLCSGGLGGSSSPCGSGGITTPIGGGFRPSEEERCN